MTRVYFKKTITISICSHLAAFIIFGFSFGRIIPKAQYADVSFFGQILMNVELSSKLSVGNLKPVSLERRSLLAEKQQHLVSEIKPDSPYSSILSGGYFKPHSIASILEAQKPVLLFRKEHSILTEAIKREPVVLLHPVLPYNVTLYFRDRKSAHVELLFKISSEGQRNPAVLLKRKISSGNLEVDLLAMRYISHYLSIRESDFIPDKWRSIKIELSAKNDQY